MTPPRRPPDFAALVRDFFCDRLVHQQDVSPHTVAAYRDTFRLLLVFGKCPVIARLVSQVSL